jgi:hypothetical protein
MSYENEQDLQDGTGAEGADDLNGGGADDLNGMGGDMAFAGEPKQPINKGTIVVIALLVACAGALYFMYVRSGPEAAVAAAPGKADETINQFLSGSEKNVQQMRDMLKNTESVVKQFKMTPPQVPLTKLSVNPFAKEPMKPDVDRDAMERDRKKQMLMAKIGESVKDLRLQTIIHRDPKKATCMINNTLYRKGQKVTAGQEKVTFTVAEIRPDGVTVSAVANEETLTFELKMKQ